MHLWVLCVARWTTIAVSSRHRAALLGRLVNRMVFFLVPSHNAEMKRAYQQAGVGSHVRIASRVRGPLPLMDSRPADADAMAADVRGSSERRSGGTSTAPRMRSKGARGLAPEPGPAMTACLKTTALPQFRESAAASAGLLS